MIARPNANVAGKARTLAALACGGACIIALWAGAATAQDTPAQPAPLPLAQSPATQPASPPAAATPPPPNAGVFGAIGKWVDDALAGVTESLDNARGTLDDAAGRAGDTARDAADTAAKVAKIPLTSVVGGRQRCVAAANKAPDCQAATDALCRDKGFITGRSVDVQSAQKCPADVWISGRQAAPGECTMETYVTRAMCQ